MMGSFQALYFQILYLLISALLECKGKYHYMKSNSFYQHRKMQNMHNINWVCTGSIGVTCIIISVIHGLHNG